MYNYSRDAGFFVNRRIKTFRENERNNAISYILKPNKINNENSLMNLEDFSQWCAITDMDSLYSRSVGVPRSFLPVPVAYVLGPISAIIEMEKPLESLNNEKYEDILNAVKPIAKKENIPFLYISQFTNSIGSKLIEKGLEGDLTSDKINVLGIISNGRCKNLSSAAIFAPTNGLFDYIERRIPVFIMK